MKKTAQLDSELEGRLILFGVAVFILLSLLAVRLYYLQVIKGEYFKDLSENNRLRTVNVLAPRGEIRDREGRLLVQNRASFDFVIIKDDIVKNKRDEEGKKKLNTLLATLAEVTGRPKQELEKAVGSTRRNREPFEPRVVIQDASHEELAKIKANEYRLPGIMMEISPARVYPFKSLAAQVLGYVAEVSPEQLLDLQEKGNSNYKQGDLIGKGGLEFVWENELRGRDGQKLVEVDAHGKRRKEVDVDGSTSGKDIELTIDIDLQKVAEQAMEGKVGAVVALDPNTGEILALVSSPSYDLNMFSRNVSPADLHRIQSDLNRPFNNRAIAGTYPSGSTFKLVSTLAALAEGLDLTNKKVSCPGYYDYGRRYFCMKREGHGALTLQQAFMTSCNIFFYRLALELGIDKLHKYGTLLGLGAVTGIDLQGEKSGLMPSREWKKANFKKDPDWQPYDTIPLAIGQGFLNVTPIKIAQMTATIVNGGRFYKPFIVRRITDNVTKHETVFEPILVRELSDIPQKVFATIREYASTVVNGDRGTGRRARIPGIEVGGKTGTAQYAALDNKNAKLDDHAWFVGFAPVSNPMIVVAVLVEHGGPGGAGASPIARQVMEMFFYKKGMIEKLSDPTLVPKGEDLHIGEDEGFIEELEIMESGVELQGI